MKIAVCIKQVPDVDDIKWTKENNLDRSQMLSKINPYDDWALDWAIRLKSKYKGVSVTAVSLGPLQAKEILSYAIAKGADRGILLSDKAFSGSDTLITAKVLASAMVNCVKEYDIIITGQMAVDGDTAQVPVSLAQLLSVPDCINVDEILHADRNLAMVSQKLGNEINVLEIKTPCLIAVNAKCPERVKIKIEDYIRAQKANIEVYGLTDLGFNKEEVGVIGSPTMVYRAYRPEVKKETIEIMSEYSKTIADIIMKAK